MLSVFMTPWMKPTCIQCATSAACRVDDAVEQCAIAVVGCAGLGIVPRDDVVGERAERLDIAARGEELEGADADMARGDAGQDGARQGFLAQHLLAGGDGGERPRRRHAERRHRLADDVLAQHRAERRPAVAAAREGRRARALELDVAALAVAVDRPRRAGSRDRRRAAARSRRTGGRRRPARSARCPSAMRLPASIATADWG